jgi:glycosyltransferase involved in cell wall biosynthesis
MTRPSGTVERDAAPKATVSVCMITYNHAPYIAQAIEGVLGQRTDFAFELVIGEDCSTDNTRQICEQFARQHPGTIRLLPGEPNMGVSCNFLRTLNACTGRYVAFCEGDDYWQKPDKLQVQVGVLEAHSSATLTAGGAQILYQDTQQVTQDVRNLEYFTFNDLLEDNVLGSATASILVRRDCISEKDKSLLAQSPIGDWTLSLVCLAHGDGIYLREPMSCYRIHDQGVWGRMSPAQRVTTKSRMYDFMMTHWPEHRDAILEFKRRLHTPSTGN